MKSVEFSSDFWTVVGVMVISLATFVYMTLTHADNQMTLTFATQKYKNNRKYNVKQNKEINCHDSAKYVWKTKDYKYETQQKMNIFA